MTIGGFKKAQIFRANLELNFAFQEFPLSNDGRWQIIYSQNCMVLLYKFSLIQFSYMHKLKYMINFSLDIVIRHVCV